MTGNSERSKSEIQQIGQASQETEPLALVFDFIADLFGEPCNWGGAGMEQSIDEYMYDNAGDWCDKHCCEIPAAECWRKFFEVKAMRE